MKILIVGNGGREHALAWKIAQSPLVKQIWVAPGNAGTADEIKTQNVNIKPTDINALLTFAKEKNIDLTIVGPEVALAAGIVDVFQAAQLKIFGPTQAAAQLETSKVFCKDFLHKNHIPTARYQTFRQIDAALAYLKQQALPIVIKASGLAAGKGVVIATTFDEAKQAIINMLENKQFGDASNEIVIEEYLTGEELSFIVMVDGKNILPLASSQDHKRLNDNDQGPNTGGMGAYSPVPRLTDELQQKIMSQIIAPTVAALNKQQTPFVGFLYAGLMISQNNDPLVLEYNVRLGDPETQPLMMRLRSDLVALIMAALEKKLDQTQATWDSRLALGVVMTAAGYPNVYRQGDIIEGLDRVTDPDVKIFHAGTREQNQKIVTAGGRVLTVVALGNDLPEAQQKAYHAVKQIHWADCYYRQDIGHRAAR
jgi:phosphoribosylamine--glycine ligase